MFDLIKQYTGLDLLPYVESGKLFEQVKHLNLDLPKDASEKKILDQLFDEKVIPNLKTPTFVIDYPAVYSPLSKIKFDQPEIAERFELYINGMEIGNAYSELNDPELQKKRFEEQMEAKQKARMKLCLMMGFYSALSKDFLNRRSWNRDRQTCYGAHCWNQ